MRKETITRSAAGTPVAGFPAATRAAHLLFVSGRAGLDRESGMPLAGYQELGRKPPPALGLLAPDSWEEAFVAQASRMYEDLETLLAEHGARKSDLLFYSIYMRDMRSFPVLARTRAALFEGGVAPPSTASQVPGLLHDAVVYFDPVAIIPDRARGVAKHVLTSRHVVQGPLSNYELATRAGDYTFYAGIVGAHPETGVIVSGAGDLRDRVWPRPAGGLAVRLRLEPIAAQTHTIYRLMREMLEEHGSGMGSLLRINAYLRDMGELPEMERIAGHAFSGGAPAGTAIGVESLARRDFFVEIEGITYAGPVRAAPADPRVASWGRYANAVRGGDLVFISGLMGYDARRDRMIMSPDDLESSHGQEVTRALRGIELVNRAQLAAAAQTREILEQMRSVLRGLDSDLGSLLKISVYLRDMADFPAVRRMLLSALGDDPPAITALAVHDLPLRAARVQVEAIAL